MKHRLPKSHFGLVPGLIKPRKSVNKTSSHRIGIRIDKCYHQAGAPSQDTLKRSSLIGQAGYPISTNIPPLTSGLGLLKKGTRLLIVCPFIMGRCDDTGNRLPAKSLRPPR
ncbi:hypothetical protein NPIL_223191 [Nephila pilipes]|uniref:Uncharacterized protein n=1 Tax=Nephila pilipes TaxID=299642 RepID=A0A8X6MIA0_NEPPI|nr:hypothetical protein NPIL_223191 [Nephila pilipes]